MFLPALKAAKPHLFGMLKAEAVSSRLTTYRSSGRPISLWGALLYLENAVRSGKADANGVSEVMRRFLD